MAVPQLAPERDFLEVNEAARTLTIRPGTWKVRRDLVIPAGYEFLAGPGAKLDLANDAAIISYSPLRFEGEAEGPVEIFSSDGSGQGVLVIRAAGTSRLSNVVFRNLTNPSVKGWVLTGAVTFYESAVDIDHGYFVASRSEDAFNLVRSSFNIRKSTFVRAKSDAVDIDFATGAITNTRFIPSGNDAIDFSGSSVTLTDILIDNAGDKGISVGEKSVLHAVRVEIRNAEIAVAVKDSSRANFDDLSIKETKLGFAVFQKKSEFGTAEVVVQSLSSDDYGRRYLVQAGSSLVINGQAVLDKLPDVEGLLYGAEYGKASAR